MTYFKLTKSRRLPLVGLAMLIVLGTNGCMKANEASECFGDVDCTDGEMCVNGGCVPEDNTDAGSSSEIESDGVIPSSGIKESEPSCTPGTETCPCRTGGSCDQGLACYSNLCVNPGSAEPADDTAPEVTCQIGAETCACREDNTCDGTLSCYSGLCVDATGTTDNEKKEGTDNKNSEAGTETSDSGNADAGVDSGTETDVATNTNQGTDNQPHKWATDTAGEVATDTAGEVATDTAVGGPEPTDTVPYVWATDTAVGGPEPTDTVPYVWATDTNPYEWATDTSGYFCAFPGFRDGCQGGTPCVLYVDENATSSGDGSEWSQALNNIQKGIDIAAEALEMCGLPEHVLISVWVAAGRYDPHADSGLNTIQMHDRVSLVGGFSGTESSMDERNLTDNLTILTTSQGGAETLVSGSGGTESIDGFVFHGEHEIGYYSDGGFANFNNCVFIEPKVAIHIENNEGTYIHNSHFVFGKRPENPDVFGHIYLKNSATGYPFTEIVHNVFSGNGDTSVIVDTGGATVRNNFFVGGASGVRVRFPDELLVDRSIFLGSNVPGNYGISAALGQFDILNSTLTNYRQDAEGGGAVLLSQEAGANIRNSIVWGNRTIESDVAKGQISVSEMSQINVTYSDIEGGWEGDGNIDTDPLFTGWTMALHTGSWTGAPSYNASTLKTVFVDNTAQWTEDLSGLFLMPNIPVDLENDPHDFLYIVSNTETELYVWGNATHLGQQSGVYRIHDFRLTADSPCVDAADGRETQDTDIYGTQVYDRIGVPNPVSCAGTSWCSPGADIGATEYRPQ